MSLYNFSQPHQQTPAEQADSHDPRLVSRDAPCTVLEHVPHAGHGGLAACEAEDNGVPRHSFDDHR